jgi:hypothetical protein
VWGDEVRAERAKLANLMESGADVATGRSNLRRVVTGTDAGGNSMLLFDSTSSHPIDAKNFVGRNL